MRRVGILAIVAVALVALATTVDTWGQTTTSAPWTGKWNRTASEIDPGGPTVFTLRQAGNHLAGTIPWKGCTTRKGGSMVGWAQGHAAVLAARQSDGTLVLAHLQLAPNGSTISGSYQITAGTCSGSGPFTATRMH